MSTSTIYIFVTHILFTHLSLSKSLSIKSNISFCKDDNCNVKDSTNDVTFKTGSELESPIPELALLLLLLALLRLGSDEHTLASNAC